MFTGLSAFPLTPLHDDRLDEPAFAGLIERLADAGVDSIGALGSTGSYAYLDRDERARAISLAVQHAGPVPVIAGIGALRQSHVLAHAEDAQRAGAAGLLLAPVSYQPLLPDEVYHLYEKVTAEIAVPLVVYDNPRTTGFAFTDDLYAAVAKLPNVVSVIEASRAPRTKPVAARPGCREGSGLWTSNSVSTEATPAERSGSATPSGGRLVRGRRRYTQYCGTWPRPGSPVRRGHSGSTSGAGRS